MTPLKLPRKTRNRLLSYAKGLAETLQVNDLDFLHDALMRAYAEGYTHGEAAERAKPQEETVAGTDGGSKASIPEARNSDSIMGPCTATEF